MEKCHSRTYQTGEWMQTIKAHARSNSVLAVALSPDGKTLATGSQNSTIKLWDVENNPAKRIAVIPQPHLSQVCSLNL